MQTQEINQIDVEYLDISSFRIHEFILLAQITRLRVTSFGSFVQYYKFVLFHRSYRVTFTKEKKLSHTGLCKYLTQLCVFKFISLSLC